MKVLVNPAKYHLQVIYTQINRDSDNVPHLKTYFLESPTKKYYYPASLVKLPLVAMALEKIDSLNVQGLTKDTRLFIDSAYYCQKREYHDSTTKTGYPSIADFIEKMLLVSDNRAYNRLYEFITPAYINKRLKELGYKNAIINQRFGGGCDTNANRFTNPFTFISNDSSRVIYHQPLDSNWEPTANSAENTVLGKGFMEGRKMKPPRDFRYSNYIPFEDENNILLSIIFPQAFSASRHFKLKPDDYRFLYKYMSMLPRESDYPAYSQKDYKDDFKKYIYFGTSDTIIDTNVRSFNIVGRAYGFIADCAYIVDVNAHTEFCLSVLMYANEKDILNIDGYQYEDLALPFMRDLGQIIYKYEKKRKKKHPADLSEFKFNYSK